MIVRVSDEVALHPVREDDLALLEDLTQNRRRRVNLSGSGGLIYGTGGEAGTRMA